MKSKVIKCLVLVNLFVASFYVVNLLIKKEQEKNEVIRLKEEIGTHNERVNLMTKEEYARLFDLRRSIHKSGVISGEDFAWALKKEREALSSDHPWACSNRDDFASLMFLPKRLTLSQKEQAYQIAIALLNAKTASNAVCNGSSEKLNAVSLIIATRDRRAVPHLLPLLDHQDNDVRQRAEQALAAFGYAPTAAK